MSCPDCNGNKRILLLTSYVDCERCKVQDAAKNGCTLLVVDPPYSATNRKKYYDWDSHYYTTEKVSAEWTINDIHYTPEKRDVLMVYQKEIIDKITKSMDRALFKLAIGGGKF